MLLAVVLILGLSSRAQYTEVDIVEFNTCTMQAHPIEQTIFWKWNDEYGRYDIASWCSKDDCEVVNSTTVRHRWSGWLIRAGEIRRTRTVHDPEMANRLLLPEEFRLGMPWEKCADHYPYMGDQ